MLPVVSSLTQLGFCPFHFADIFGLNHPTPTMAAFLYPPFYAYPPYFTLQPVEETRAKQVQAWKALIFDFCVHHNIHTVSADDHADGTVDVLPDPSSPLFVNAAIHRALKREAKVVFLDALVAEGHGEWLEADKHRCRVFFKTLAEYVSDVRRWVDENALHGSVYTLYEMAEATEIPDEWKRLDRDVLHRIFVACQSSGVASVFGGENGEDVGVKFL